MSLATAQKRKVEDDFSVDNLLDSVAKVDDDGKKKSSVVEVELDQEGQKLVGNIRLNKEQVETLTSILKIDEKMLFDIIEPLRTQLLNERGYFSSLKVADTSGLYLVLSYMDRYKIVPAESADAIRSIVGEKYEDWFESDYEVTMKSDLSGFDKKDFFTRIGTENVTRFLNVKKKLKVTTRFTQESHTMLSEEELAQLERVGVTQIKAVKPK